MNFKEQLSDKVGKFCAIQVDGLVKITFIPTVHANSAKEVKEYCEIYKCGIPGTVNDIGDDCISIGHFSGYTKRSSVIPFNCLIIEEGSR